MSNANGAIKFKGYTSPNFTQVPDELFDEQLPYLSGAELKTLLYIMRRTFGFKKTSDDISLSQICEGITTRDGRVLDQGTGLSRSTAQLAIKGLVDKNLITATKRYSQARGNEATTYSLNLGSTPYTENRHSPVPKIDPALDRKSVTQETGSQETDQQQTEITSNKTNSNDCKSKHTYAQLSTSLRRQSTVDNQPRPMIAGDDPDRRPTPTGWSTVQAVAERLFADQPDQPARRAAPATARSGRGRPSKAPPYLATTIEEITHRLNDDPKNVRSNTTRAVKLWKVSGLPEDKFVQRLYEARSLAQQQGNVTKRAVVGTSGPINRVPYFFAVVEDLLGLKGEGQS